MNHAAMRPAIVPERIAQTIKRRTSPANRPVVPNFPEHYPTSNMDCSRKDIRSSLQFPDHPMKVIYVHDLDGNLTFLNRRGEQLLGYSCEEACRMNISEIVSPEIARRVRDEILDSTNRKIGVVYEIEVIAKDGHRVPLEVSTSVVFDHGEPVEIEGIALPPIR